MWDMIATERLNCSVTLLHCVRDGAGSRKKSTARSSVFAWTFGDQDSLDVSKLAVIMAKAMIRTAIMRLISGLRGVNAATFVFLHWLITFTNQDSRFSINESALVKRCSVLFLSIQKNKIMKFQ